MSSNSVHRRRAPPFLIWRRAMASRPAIPGKANSMLPAPRCARLVTASRSAIVVAGACALTDGRPISATARLHNELLGRKASALTSRSRRVERKPLPLPRDPSARPREKPKATTFGWPSYERRSFNDGRIVDPPVFPQANPRTSAGQISPDPAVVRGQPDDRPGSCRAVCT